MLAKPSSGRMGNGCSGFNVLVSRPAQKRGLGIQYSRLCTPQPVGRNEWEMIAKAVFSRGSLPVRDAKIGIDHILVCLHLCRRAVRDLAAVVQDGDAVR